MRACQNDKQRIASLSTDERFNLVEHLINQDRFHEAKQVVDRELDSQPDNGRLWELKGMIHHLLEEFRQSVAAIERASLLIPLSPASRVMLGLGYARIGKQVLSRDLLTSLLESGDLSIDWRLQIASALDALGYPDLAVHGCRGAIEQDPLSAQAYYDMAYYTGRCQRPPHVTESLIRKAIDLGPDRAQFRIGLAALLIETDRAWDAYQAVRNLTHAQIDNLNCQCCLTRISDLYDAAGDYRRSVLCRERMLILESKRSETDCG